MDGPYITDVYNNTQSVLKLEWVQTVKCLGAKIYGSMNNKMFKRSGKIIHRERMSMNVWKHVGHKVMIKMCKKNRKRGRYHFYLDINYKSLASLVGLDSLRRKIEGKQFFITAIDMKYNEDNMMLNIDYWLVFTDRGGVIHSKAQAAAK